jgi:hypothetical protein
MKNEPVKRTCRIFICASCGKKGGTMVKVDQFYYHEKCPHVLNQELLRNCQRIREAENE